MVLILDHWEQEGWIDRWVYVGARVKEVSFVSVIPGDWVVIRQGPRLTLGSPNPLPKASGLGNLTSGNTSKQAYQH